MEVLHLQTGDDPPQRVFLDRPRLTIGRSNQNDVPVADIMLSRRHCEVVLRDGAVWLNDLGSRNGVFIAGQRIAGETRLAVGTVATLGNTSLMLRRDDTTNILFEESAGLNDGTIRISLPDLARRANAPAAELGRDQLAAQARSLRLLNSVNKALIRHMELGDLYDFVLDTVFETLNPERAALLLRNAAGEVEVARLRAPGKNEQLRISRTLIREVVEGRNAVVALDAAGDQRFAQAHSIVAGGITSILAAPLWDDEEVIGLVYLDSTLARRSFEEADLELLAALANVAAVKIQNARLTEEAMEKRRIDGEIKIAAEIQRRMLPQAMPVVPGFALHADNLPSRSVSGDYYDVVTRPDGTMLLLVADVCGKGISAAMLMASLQASFRASAVGESDPAELLRRLNDVIHGNSAAGKFATAFLGLFDPATGELRYASAGHNEALLGCAGEQRLLRSTGVPLGLFAGRSYTNATETMAPGETLCVYTDGITEATSPEEEEWGRDRLAALLASRCTTALPDLAGEIVDQVRAFVAGAPQQDDITLLLVRRDG